MDSFKMMGIFHEVLNFNGSFVCNYTKYDI